MTLETLFTSFGGAVGIFIVYRVNRYFDEQKKKAEKSEETIKKHGVDIAVIKTKLESHENRATRIEKILDEKQ